MIHLIIFGSSETSSTDDAFKIFKRKDDHQKSQIQLKLNEK